MENLHENWQHSTISELVRKWKKRPHPPVYNGVGMYEDKNTDFLCPICIDLISEAYMTKCGHTFCYSCIKRSLEYDKKCPKCNIIIESVDEVYPNFILNELITKHKQKIPEKRMRYDSAEAVPVPELQKFLSCEKDSLTIEDVNRMLEILAQKKQQLEADCRETQLLLLKEFLQKVRTNKQEELRQLQQQISVIDSDTRIVEEMLQNHALLRSKTHYCPNSIHVKSEPSTSSSCNHTSCSTNMQKQDGFNGSEYSDKYHNIPLLSSRRKRMYEHFKDLEDSYIKLRSKELIFTACDEPTRCGLDDFSDGLAKFTRYNSIRTLATLNYSNDHFQNTSIVSSIEFDKDNEYFAIAGVTKKIKVYEYAAVIRESIDLHYAVHEMLCNSKISCVSFSSYHKNMLASSDYEGTVTLWDAFTGAKVKTYQEHEKRCWSVDFNRIDTKVIASGSDDAKVKLWSTSLDHSITSLDAKANVCCVKFNPESRFHLAFGSAVEDKSGKIIDHSVHYYDLRNTKQPLEVFKGHKKAVSYVKFLNNSELVSASTDSELKLWNINQSHCIRTFKGHTNEKNFVGLATDGDFIACGSENNSLYVYYKGLSSQVLTFKFISQRSILDKDGKEEDTNEFVSAVCWRMGSNVVVAANSQGSVKILELV